MGKGGRSFTTNVHAFVAMKLRQLNAGHQIIATAGELLSVETIAGTMAHSLNHNIPEALAGIRAYGDDIARVVSHRMALDEVAEVFKTKAPDRRLKVQYVRS